MTLRVLDLFSGIGGFSLGLERAGMRTVAFCEIEPFCRSILRKHWPDVPIYEDVRTLTADALARDGIAVDVICGGFPCQDVSHAGKRAGLEGARSGLWSEYARLIGELRPRFVIVENVPGLLSLGMGTVLGDLAALGYDATWDCIPASAVGAPHRRDRVWVVAYADSGGRSEPDLGREQPRGAEAISTGESPHPAPMQRPSLKRGEPNRDYERAEDVADATGSGLEGSERCRLHGAGRLSEPPVCGHWGFEPDVGRVAHGVPKRVDRLRGLGNAVVPQIPEMIGRAILAAA